MFLVFPGIQREEKDLIKTYLDYGRAARRREDWEEAMKYYGLAQMNDPSNAEAVFNYSYTKLRNSLYYTNLFKVQSAITAFQKSFFMLRDNFNKDDDLSIICMRLYSQQVALAVSSVSIYIVKTVAYEVWDGVYNQLLDLSDEFIRTLDDIIIKEM